MPGSKSSSARSSARSRASAQRSASIASSPTIVRFVDGNVLLYSISKDRDEAEKAKRANELRDNATRLSRFSSSACRRHGRAGPDAAIIEAARVIDCRTVLSEDMSHGRDHDGVMVVEPFRNGGGA